MIQVRIFGYYPGHNDTIQIHAYGDYYVAAIPRVGEEVLLPRDEKPIAPRLVIERVVYEAVVGGTPAIDLYGKRIDE